MKDLIGFVLVISFGVGVVFFAMYCVLSAINPPITEELFVRVTTGEGVICKVRTEKGVMREIISLKTIPSMRYTVSGRLIKMGGTGILPAVESEDK